MTDKDRLRAIIRHLEDTPWPVGEMTTDDGKYALMVCRENVRKALAQAKKAAK